MLCFASFIFILVINAALEAGTITLGQAIFCEIYGLLMFHYTSKPYWTNSEDERRNRNAK